VILALAAQQPRLEWVRPRSRSAQLIAPAALLGALALAFTPHAGVLKPSGGDVFLVTVHILGAGMWAGGIVALSLQHVPGGWRSPDGQELVARFSRVALIAFAITAFTGVIRASEALSGLGDLVSTTYGQVLLFKSVGVLAMVALSAVAWRRRTGSPKLEALIALFVIAMATLLYATPLTQVPVLPATA
jgi:putative copper export protein